MWRLLRIFYPAVIVMTGSILFAFVALPQLALSAQDVGGSFKAKVFARFAHTVDNRIHRRKDRVEFFGIGRYAKSRFDGKQHFHPDSPEDLAVSCSAKIKNIGVYYALYAPTREHNEFSIDLTYRWVFDNLSEPASVEERTFPVKFNRDSSALYGAAVKSFNKGELRNGRYQLEIVVTDEVLVQRSFVVSGCV